MLQYHFFSFQAKFADLTRVQCQQWPPEVQNRFSRPRSRSWTRPSSCLAWRRNLSRREDQWEASILVTWQFSTNKKPPEVQNRFSRPRDRPSGNRFFSLKPLWSQLRVLHTDTFTTTEGEKFLRKFDQCLYHFTSRKGERSKYIFYLWFKDSYSKLWTSPHHHRQLVIIIWWCNKFPIKL